tara:strand:+ start:240 stop:587 length:348 start_codon:yes stop_codon:yes gene_type:complete
MKFSKFCKNVLLLIAISSLSGCALTDLDEANKPHPVLTLDQEQAKQLDCVFLYSTNQTESGSDLSRATSYALYVLKNQAQVLQGNALVIRNISSSKSYERYEFESVNISVDVYKC